jgi:hypothetical protein
MTLDLMDLRIQAQDAVRSNLDAFGTFVVTHPEGMMFAATIFLCVILILFVHNRINGGKKKGNTMAQRQAYLDRLYADMIGDALFDLMYAEKISRQEYRAACKRLGIQYGLSDLLPVRLHPKAIAHRVKKNCRTTKLLDASGLPIQPSIPGPKPAEVIPVPPQKQPKRWVTRGKALLRR